MDGQPLKAAELLFDLDGTLWSPMELSLHCWRQACARFSVSDHAITEDALRSCFGRQPAHIVRTLVGDAPRFLREKICGTAFALENEMIGKGMGTLYPEVPEVLEYLSGTHTLFIVSNCQDGYIEAFLDAYGLAHCFADVCPAGETGLSKAELIRSLIGSHDLQDPVYIGDTPQDAQAAGDAGIPFVFASYGFGEVPRSPYVLNSFADLPGLLGESMSKGETTYE
jgi:phosphoglycolate phosphatase